MEKRRTIRSAERRRQLLETARTLFVEGGPDWPRSPVLRVSLSGRTIAISPTRKRSSPPSAKQTLGGGSTRRSWSLRSQQASVTHFSAGSKRCPERQSGV